MAKRQTRGSSSTPGVFTRSRSEIFVHRNRSGRVRPDRSRAPRPRLDSISPPLSSERLSADAVKDLRTQRVVSPEASPVKRDAIRLVEGGKKPIDPAEEEAERIDLAGGGAYEVVEPSDGPEVELIHCTPPVYQNAMEVESASQDLTTAGGPEAVADVTVESTYPPKCRLEPLSEEVMKPSDGSEELIHCTPPDNEIAMEVENMSQDQTVLGVPAVITADVKMASADPPRSSPALIRCSRSKLYRNSSSFSYRRLLPYLMNITKDDSGGTRVVTCKDYPVNVEKVVKETTSLPTKGKLSVDQHLAERSRCSVSVESCETLGFVESPINVSPNKSSSNGDLHDLEVTTSNLCNQSGLEFEEIKSEDCLHDPILESRLLCNPSISPRAVHESLSEEELSGNVLAQPFLPSTAQFSCNMIGSASDVKGKSLPRTSLLGSINSLEKHALAPRKGILKKHTRSCKGICMCLDCVTFRIRANYAFDFSRKQMKDADEIIFGLVKEVAALRNIVEKSIIPTYEGTRTCALLQLNQELLKQACQRASRAEKIANSRSKQMFNDLNVHCRIPGPRVTFAGSVEERISPREQQE